MEKSYSFNYLNKIYPVIVTKKRISRVWYRFRNDTIYISVPYLCPIDRALKELKEIAPKLIRETKKVETPISNEYVYLLGEKVANTYSDFYKEIKKDAKKLFESRLRHYEEVMHIPTPYKLRCQQMSSRYGSNSGRTHTINLSLVLMHYSLEIIDSVVIHELCHDKIKNHQKGFYDLLLRYCPNYMELRKKLRKGEYK